MIPGKSSLPKLHTMHSSDPQKCSNMVINTSRYLQFFAILNVLKESVQTNKISHNNFQKPTKDNLKETPLKSNRKPSQWNPFPEHLPIQVVQKFYKTIMIITQTPPSKSSLSINNTIILPHLSPHITNLISLNPRSHDLFPC